MFRKFLFFVKSEAEFQVFMDSHLFGYLDCIRIEEIVSVEGGGDFNVSNEGLRDNCNVSIFHEYYETIVDTIRNIIKEIINNKNYRKN